MSSFTVVREPERTTFRGGWIDWIPTVVVVGFGVLIVIAMVTGPSSAVEPPPSVAARVLWAGGACAAIVACSYRSSRAKVVLDAEGVTLTAWRRIRIPWSDVAGFEFGYGPLGSRSAPRWWSTEPVRAQVRTTSGALFSIPFTIGYTTRGRSSDAAAELSRVVRATSERLCGRTIPELPPRRLSLGRR